MNDLELEIAALPIPQPSDQLDERIMASLATCRVRQPADAVRAPVVWTVAVICLLFGALAGYAGGGLYAPSSAGRSNAMRAGGFAATALADVSTSSEVDSLLLTAHLNDTRFELCQRCHQSTEGVAEQVRQLRFVAQQRAAVWEQETGEAFLLASHVADERFAACRQCHVLESAVESM